MVVVVIWWWQHKYNKEYPAIFGTYQLYLKDALGRLKDDMDRASRQNYHFAAKLVRQVGEGKRSVMGYTSLVVPPDVTTFSLSLSL